MKTTIPPGYLHPFPKSAVPEGWSPMDGRDGRPDMSTHPTEIQNGHGPVICFHQSVWCMFDWATFHASNPDWTPNVVIQGPPIGGPTGMESSTT